MLSNWEKIAGFIFGVVFLATVLVLTVVIPNPTPFQYVFFKTVLAIAASGIGGILAGFLHVEGSFQKLSLRAGGALALFVIVFFFSPAPPNSGKPPIKQIVEPEGTGIVHTGSGDINVNGYTIEEHERILKKKKQYFDET